MTTYSVYVLEPFRLIEEFSVENIFDETEAIQKAVSRAKAFDGSVVIRRCECCPDGAKIWPLPPAKRGRKPGQKISQYALKELSDVSQFQILANEDGFRQEPVEIFKVKYADEKETKLQEARECIAKLLEAGICTEYRIKAYYRGRSGMKPEFVS